MFQTHTAASQQALENPATITTADFIKPKKMSGGVSYYHFIKNSSETEISQFCDCDIDHATLEVELSAPRFDLIATNLGATIQLRLAI
jgi:hypothetical protein